MCTDLAKIGVDPSFGEEPPEDEYQVLVAGRPLESLLDREGLESLVIPFAGLPDTTRESLLARPQLTTYNLHHNAAPVAELAIALYLAASKTLIPIDRRFRQGDWRDRGKTELALGSEGKRAVVLGYGEIGRRVVRACLGLGMRVRAIATRARREAGFEVDGPKRLHAHLQEADVLFVCLPLTPSTERLIERRELNLLSPNAIVVNVSRGRVVSERALYYALKRGAIFAAGLDVWWRYPKEEAERESTFPADVPFHELDNVVLSPHRGGHVRRDEKNRRRALVELLEALVQGNPPKPVEPLRGY